MYKTIVAILALTLIAGCRDAEGESTILRVPKDLPTISAALYFAQRGHTIEVSANKGGVDGYYTEVTGEYFPLEVRDGITIRRGAPKVTIDMDGAYTAPLFRVIGNDVTIEGFTFHSTSGRAATAIEACGVHNLTIRNCDFRLHAGVFIEGAHHVTLEGNTFSPWHGGEEVPPRAAVIVRNSSDVTIQHNTISGFTQNVICEWSDRVTIKQNVIIDGFIGIVLDGATLSTASIVQNDVWRNVTDYYDTTTRMTFLPKTGDNISSDPRFVDRDGIYDAFDFSPHESSPVVLADGIMGARSAVHYAAQPTMTRGSNTSLILRKGPIADILHVTMTNLGEAPVRFDSGLRLWVRCMSTKPIQVLKLFEIVSTTSFGTGSRLVAEGQVEQGAARLLLNQDFPSILNPGEVREFWFAADTSNFASGDSLTLEILSMEWLFEDWSRVNDGFTPFGLPISHTATMP